MVIRWRPAAFLHSLEATDHSGRVDVQKLAKIPSRALSAKIDPVANPRFSDIYGLTEPNRATNTIRIPILP